MYVIDGVLHKYSRGGRERKEREYTGREKEGEKGKRKRDVVSEDLSQVIIIIVGKNLSMDRIFE